jgi:hypothetical protein
MKFFIKEKFRERKIKIKNNFSDDESEEQNIFIFFYSTRQEFILPSSPTEDHRIAKA